MLSPILEAVQVPDVNNPVNKKEEQEQVIFEGPVDSVYTKVPDRVALDVGTGESCTHFAVGILEFQGCAVTGQ